MSQKTALVTMRVTARYIAEVPETDLPSILQNANQKMEDSNCGPLFDIEWEPIYVELSDGTEVDPATIQK